MKCRELRDAVPNAVSLVHKGANKKRFTIFKSDEGGTPMPEGMDEKRLGDTVRKVLRDALGAGEKTEVSQLAEQIEALTSMVKELKAAPAVVPGEVAELDDGIAKKLEALEASFASLSKTVEALTPTQEQKADESESEEAALKALIGDIGKRVQAIEEARGASKGTTPEESVQKSKLGPLAACLSR